MDESVQNSAASGWAALITLVSMGLGWWWGWRQVTTFAHRKQFSSASRVLACFFAAWGAMLGAFCLVGAVALPGTNDVAVAMVVFGVLVLSPFLWLWRRNLKPLPSSDSEANSNTKILVAPPAAMDTQITQPPAVDSSFVMAPGIASSTPSYDENIAPIRPEQFHFVSSGSVSRSPEISGLDESTAQDLDLAAIHAFTYKRNDAVVSNRRVQIVQGMFNGGSKYLGGVCLDANEWRTFRLDRIKGRITNEDTGELITPNDLYASLASAGKTGKTVFKEATSSRTLTQAREWETAVFFAGFRGSKLDELESLAMDAGWQVRSSITHTVDYVVRNGGAGQKQLADAEKMGISVIDEDVFRALV